MTTLQPAIVTKVVFPLRVLHLGFPSGGIRLVHFWFEKPPKSECGSCVWLNLATNCVLFFGNMATIKATVLNF